MDELFQPKKFMHLIARKISKRKIGRAPLAFLTGLFCFSLVGCAANGSRGDISDRAAAPIGISPEQCAARAQIYQAATADHGYIIQPGDQLEVDFYLNGEFNDSATVRPDGKIALRLVGDVQASGLTPAQLAENLDKEYSTELRSPDAAIHVKNMPNQVVYVDGQVGKPGGIPLEAGMTALQAIAYAGGLTPDAGSQAVLIRRDACGSPEGSKLNLDVAAQDPSKGEDVALLPRDILLVPRSGIANLDLWMKQHVRDLLPVQTFAPLPL
jgi:protein involved in polysaccharide export with SLBB domain